MNGASLREFEVEGRRMVFDAEAFKDLFRRNAVKAGRRVGEYEEDVATAAFVGPDAVHSWRMGGSGPGDLGKIEALAAFWGVDPGTLLKEKGETMAGKLDDRQLEALRRIYAAIVDYLEDFRYSFGFNDYWFEFTDAGVAPERVEPLLYEKVEGKRRAVETAARKEALDLRGEPVYDALLDYICDDLVDIYGCKLSYAYRFEAPVELEGGGTSGVLLEDDYEGAYKRLHAILDRWV